MSQRVSLSPRVTSPRLQWCLQQEQSRLFGIRDPPALDPGTLAVLPSFVLAARQLLVHSADGFCS